MRKYKSNFQESVDNAKKVFRTTTPFRDIDDIVRKINHIKIENKNKAHAFLHVLLFLQTGNMYITNKWKV